MTEASVPIFGIAYSGDAAMQDDVAYLRRILEFIRRIEEYLQAGVKNFWHPIRFRMLC